MSDEKISFHEVFVTTVVVVTIIAIFLKILFF